MAGNPYHALNMALSNAMGASSLLEDGVAMLDVLDAPGLPFIVMGLKAQLAELTLQLDEATQAARAVLPKPSPRKVCQALVAHLAQRQGLALPKAALPALARAYEAEAAAAEPHTTAGVVLDRAMRRMEAEAAA